MENISHICNRKKFKDFHNKQEKLFCLKIPAPPNHQDSESRQNMRGTGTAITHDSAEQSKHFAPGPQSPAPSILAPSPGSEQGPASSAAGLRLSSSSPAGR